MTEMAEAKYLCTILNSPVITVAVRSFQARGEHNPRHYDKYIWQLPIPRYDAKDPRHRRLFELGEQAEAFVADLELPRTRFEKQRRYVREQLEASEIGQAIDTEVAALLGVGG